MSGWRLAVVVVASFGLGYMICLWRKLGEIEYLRNVSAGLKAMQNHEPCIAVNEWLARLVVAHQQHIDHLEGKPGVAAQASDFLRKEGGS